MSKKENTGMDSPKRESVIGSQIVRIGHSEYSEPLFVIEGIGPARFRSHFIQLENGLVLDLFTATLTLASATQMVCEGETEGIPASDLIGRTLTGVWRDDVFSSILILDNLIYLKDANDGAYGNPLRAGYIASDYSATEIAEFLEYWTEFPIPRDRAD